MKYLIFLLLSSINQQPKDSILLIEKLINIEADQLHSDRFDNLYIISGHTIYKYNSLGIKQSEYSSERGEKITDLDCKNPFKLIVSYSEQNKFILLDNNLTKIAKDVFYEDLDIQGDALITGSFDNGFKIYDKTFGIFYKTNSEFNIEFQKYKSFQGDPIKILNNKNYIAIMFESGKISFYNNDLNEIGSLESNSIVRSCKLNENTFSVFSTQSQSILISGIEKPENVLKELFFPSNLSISDALIGHKKIFAKDSSSVYIAKFPLVKE